MNVFKECDSEDVDKKQDNFYSQWRDRKSQLEDDSLFQKKSSVQSKVLDYDGEKYKMIDGKMSMENRQPYNERQVELQLAYNQIQKENISLINQLKDLSQDNQQLNLKLKQIENSLDSLYHDKVAKGSSRLENATLKQDNDRLVSLLSQTQEYKNCFQMGEQITYLKRVPSTDFVHSKKIKIILSKDKENLPEELLWVPTQAFQIASGYGLSEEDKVNLLVSINVAFHQFWDSKVKKLQQLKDQDVQKLKRQIQCRQPFDELCAQKTIARLKSQVKQQRNKDISQDENKTTAQLAQLQECFKKISFQEKQLKDLRNQLTDQKKNTRSNLEEQDHQKDQFLKGSMQMIERCVEIMEQHKFYIQTVSVGLNNKIDSLIECHDTAQQQIITKVYKWLIDVVDETQNHLFDKIMAIKKSTVIKVGSVNQ